MLRIEAWPQAVDAQGQLAASVRGAAAAAATVAAAAMARTEGSVACTCCNLYGALMPRRLPVWPSERRPFSATLHLTSHLADASLRPPCVQEDEARPADFPPCLTKRDATAFVKAVRQRGLLSKLDLIALGGWVGGLGG